jgi:hypothetical protein
MEHYGYRVYSEVCKITGITMYYPQKRYFGIFWWNLYSPVCSSEQAYSIIISDRNCQKARTK